MIFLNFFTTFKKFIMLKIKIKISQNKLNFSLVKKYFLLTNFSNSKQT